MKKYVLFLTVTVLTLSMFTGCGCTPQNMTEPVMPTRDTATTVPETVAPTIPSEEATTLPDVLPPETIDATQGSDGIMDPSQGANGNMDATGDVTDATSPMNSRSGRSGSRR